MKEINTYIDLYIEFPAKIIEIENVEITECLNEHGICKASLYIISENNFNFINKITSETDIKIVIKTEEKTDVIFAGIMTNLTAKKIEYTYKIDIELKSKTFRLDCEKKSKSFKIKIINIQIYLQRLLMKIIMETLLIMRLMVVCRKKLSYNIKKQTGSSAKD